jgi:hypothetical protein
MGIGGLIGGALTGIGRGMEMQAVAQQKEAEDMRRDDALMRRQTALAKYQDDLQAAQNKVQHGYKLDEIKTELGVRRAAEIAKAVLDFKLEVKKMEKAHGYKLSEAQVESGLAAARDAARAGVEIAHWEVDSETGQLVGFTKTGIVYRFREKPLRQKGGSGGILDAYDEGGDISTDAPDSSGSSGGTSSKTYTMAEAAATAKNRGIPLSLIHI